jgi:hypothetical protein
VPSSKVRNLRGLMEKERTLVELEVYMLPATCVECKLERLMSILVPFSTPNALD